MRSHIHDNVGHLSASLYKNGAQRLSFGNSITAAGSAGARGALPRGAGNAVRTKGYPDVEGSLPASAQSLSPQSLDVENAPLVLIARR